MMATAANSAEAHPRSVRVSRGKMSAVLTREADHFTLRIREPGTGERSVYLGTLHLDAQRGIHLPTASPHRFTLGGAWTGYVAEAEVKTASLAIIRVPRLGIEVRLSDQGASLADVQSMAPERAISRSRIVRRAEREELRTSLATSIGTRGSRSAAFGQVRLLESWNNHVQMPPRGWVPVRKDGVSTEVTRSLPPQAPTFIFTNWYGGTKLEVASE